MNLSPKLLDVAHKRLFTKQSALKLEKVHQLFYHEVDKGNKYGGKHVADFDFLNFKEVNTDGHDQYATDSGHLINDSGN